MAPSAVFGLSLTQLARASRARRVVLQLCPSVLTVVFPFHIETALAAAVQPNPLPGSLDSLAAVDKVLAIGASTTVRAPEKADCWRRPQIEPSWRRRYEPALDT